MDMRAALLALSLAVAASASAQARPVRIPIRHADPWAIKAMLEGRPIVSPELSTVLLLGGQAPAGTAVNALFRNGRFVVNPADNSLWFIPDGAGASG